MRTEEERTEAMVRNMEEHQVVQTGSKAAVGSSHEGSSSAMPPRYPIPNDKPKSMVLEQPPKVIPPHIIAEAISSFRGLDLRWSGPATPIESQYVEQYVRAKYPQYSHGLIEQNDKTDISSFHPEDKQKSKGPRESPPSFGRHLPELAKAKLEPSRLLNILTEKSSFPGSFISIPEVQARSLVLKYCGLIEEEYMVIFAANYKQAMCLVGESYPFFSYNFYMTTIEESVDDIREFATYKESKVFPMPETWLDLTIPGSQLSQYFRRKCRHSPKGLFSMPAKSKGTRYSLHWILEAHRNKWHVLLDASELIIGKDRLNLAMNKPDFLLCTINNTRAQPSKITCLLVRR